VENDYEIDLNELDSVRENLNGFWVPENQIESKSILWLNFHKKKNFSTWEIIPFTEEIKRTESLPIKSCPTLTGLIKLNGKIQMEFVSLGGSDTTEIESLTKTKFKIDGMTYLRHKGYDFLKTWNVHEYEMKKSDFSKYKNSELLVLYQDFKNEITEIIWTDEPPAKLSGVIFIINKKKYFEIELDSIPELYKMNLELNWKLNEVGNSRIRNIKLVEKK